MSASALHTLFTRKLRRLPAALLFPLLFLLPPTARAAENLSDSAIIYYEKNEFAKAAACYEKILAGGRESWILHYNLGNAYFKNNQLGRAILHYQVARRMNPASQDIRNNLKIAESRTTDKIDSKTIYLEDEIRNFLINRLSTAGWAWLGIGLLALCLLLFFFFYDAQRPGAKRVYFWTALVAAVLFILSLILGFAALDEKNTRTDGVILTPEATLYNSPRADESNKKSLTLHEGTEVKILSTEQGWSNVQLRNGNEGWLRSESLGVY